MGWPLLGLLGKFGSATTTATVVGGGALAADQALLDGKYTDPFLETAAQKAPGLVKKAGAAGEIGIAETTQVAVKGKWEGIWANLENFFLMVDRALGGGGMFMKAANWARSGQSQKNDLAWNGQDYVELNVPTIDPETGKEIVTMDVADIGNGPSSSTPTNTPEPGFKEDLASLEKSLTESWTDLDGDGKKELNLANLGNVAKDSLNLGKSSALELADRSGISHLVESNETWNSIKGNLSQSFNDKDGDGDREVVWGKLGLAVGESFLATVGSAMDIGLWTLDAAGVNVDNDLDMSHELTSSFRRDMAGEQPETTPAQEPVTPSMR